MFLLIYSTFFLILYEMGKNDKAVCRIGVELMPSAAPPTASAVLPPSVRQVAAPRVYVRGNVGMGSVGIYCGIVLTRSGLITRRLKNRR